MFLQYKDLEIALDSRSYLEHVFIGLFQKRHFWIYPTLFIFFGVFGKIFDIFNFKLELSLSWRIFIYPIAIYLILALLMGLLERKFLLDFLNLNKDKKIKSLKNFFVVTGTLQSFAFMIAILNIKIFKDFEFATFQNLILSSVLLVVLIITAFLLTLWFSNYKKVFPEIERKGLLTDEFKTN